MTLIKTSFVSPLLAMLLIILSAPATAQSTNTSGVKASITLKPEKCVSLRQGQVCYADVELQWQANQQGHYCLLSSSQEAPLMCWNGKQQGQFTGEIRSDSNVIFTLTQQRDGAALASAEMKMAWVYKKKRSAVSWRVF